MKKLLQLLGIAALCVGVVAGCGGDKEKGVNSNKDRPTAPDRGK